MDKTGVQLPVDTQKIWFVLMSYLITATRLLNTHALPSTLQDQAHPFPRKWTQCPQQGLRGSGSLSSSLKLQRGTLLARPTVKLQLHSRRVTGCLCSSRGSNSSVKRDNQEFSNQRGQHISMIVSQHDLQILIPGSIFNLRLLVSPLRPETSAIR